jgi:S-DNA-T family DNA segregation ATPase FtsK/SpoIIIE
MAKNTFKTNSLKNKEKKAKKSLNLKLNFLEDRRFQLTAGFFLLGLSLFFLVAFVSYLFTGKADQSVVESVQEVGLFKSGLEVDNWMKLYGALSAHYFIFEWFGVGSFLIPPLLFLYGYRIVFRKAILPINSATIFVVFFLLWISLFLGDMVNSTDEPGPLSFLSGGIGYDLAIKINSLVGWGTILILLFSLIVFALLPCGRDSAARPGAHL